jgi:hypothetical protein
MAHDYERLQKQIEAGLDAVRELKKMADEQKRREQPKLKLIRGGLLGGALWAGVEWLRNYKLGVVLAATAATFVGGVIAEQPHAPGADPPAAISKPTPPRSSVSPSAPPRVAAPTPRRTSPPRTYARVVPPAEPSKSAPSKTPKGKVPHVSKTPVTKTPKVLPSLPVKVPVKTPTIPVIVETPECTIGLLGLCILG